MKDRLNELNDKIIENLEKQVANYEDIIKINDTKIADLERRLDVATKVLEEIKSYTALYHPAFGESDRNFENHYNKLKELAKTSLEQIQKGE